MLPRQITDYLQREGGDYALARVKCEFGQLDELLAELGMVNERSFKLSELDGNLRLDLDIAGRYGRGAASDESKARIAGDLAECAERSQELRARSAALSARTAPLEKRIERCRQRIAAAVRGGGAPLRFMPLPNIDKKITLAVARDRVLQIGADIKEIEAAPHTSGEVKELITRWVDEKLCAPAVGHLFDRGMEHSGVFLGGREVGDAWQPDQLGLSLWLNRDEFIGRLHASADRLADDGRALSDDERAKKIEQCKAALLEAERVEEALAWQHLQNGEPIVLRADADVRAILSIG